MATRKIQWKQTFTKDNKTLRNAEISFYYAGTNTAATVYDENDNVKTTAPQVTTDSTGSIEVYFAPDEYASGQLFDCLINPSYSDSSIASYKLTSLMLLQDDDGYRNFKNIFIESTLPEESGACAPQVREHDVCFLTSDNNKIYTAEKSALGVLLWVDRQDGDAATALLKAEWAYGYTYLSQAFNLIADPNFSKTTSINDKTFWDQSSSIYWNGTGGNNGGSCIQLVGHSAISYCFAQNQETKIKIPSIKDEVFYVRFRAKRDSSFDGSLDISIREKNINDTALSWHHVTVTSSQLTTSYQVFDGIITLAHTDCSDIEMYITLNSDATTGNAYIDDVLVTRAIDWDSVITGTNMPDDNADVTNDNTADNTDHVEGSVTRALYNFDVYGGVRVNNGTDIEFYSGDGASGGTKVGGVYADSSYGMYLKSSNSKDVYINSVANTRIVATTVLYLYGWNDIEMHSDPGDIKITKGDLLVSDNAVITGDFTDTAGKINIGTSSNYFILHRYSGGSWVTEHAYITDS